MPPLTTTRAESADVRPTLDAARRISSWFGRHRLPSALIGLVAIVGIFLGYFRMSATVSINSDGSSNALQAWDMIHGNPLLSGWTVTDVSFYTTELLQYVLVELVYGYHANVIHAAAAMTYTLALILAAAVAKGRATGREAVARVAVAVAIMLVPGALTGYIIVLGSPAHFGTSVPLLVAWLVLDRFSTERDGSARERTPWWLAPAVAVLLTWGTIGDPLVMYIGALPLLVVSLIRMITQRRWSPRRWRGLDAQLVLAAVASVLLARGSVHAIRLAGGFHVHQPIAELAPVERLSEHAWLLVKSLAVVFGAYFPDLPGPLGAAVGVLKVLGLLLIVGAVVLVTVQTVRGIDPPGGGRTVQILACGIGVNACAFVVSTLPWDLWTSRHVAALVPIGAALAGRLLAPRIAALRLMPVVAVALAVSLVAFVVRSTDPPVTETGSDVGAWLEARNLTHGLGGYWGANVITLNTSGRVTVAPTMGVGDKVMGYRWESRKDWYDPARSDARFMVIDRENLGYGGLDAAIRQFGEPVDRKDFERFTVLVYDHNLLVGLPAYCVPTVAPTMADCWDLDA